MYSQRYWKQQIFDSIEIVRGACAAEGIAMDAAAIRWLLHHSILSGKHCDGIIFGASSLQHCQRNLEARAASLFDVGCAFRDSRFFLVSLQWQAAVQGPLPAALVQAYDLAWERCRFVSSAYFRNYGTAPGVSNTFLLKHQDAVPNSVL